MSRSASDAAPDLLLVRGRVYTVDPADRVVEAVAIKDGRVAAVGSTSEMRVLAGPRTRVVDLGERAVIPAFFDGHPHMDSLGQRLLRPSFEGVKSIEDVQAVVGRAVAGRRPGEWIVTNALAEEPDVYRLPGSLREGRWPTRHDLDRVAPANPVLIIAPMLVAPGVAIANSAALAASGVTRDTRVPDGVEIDVDAAGAPTGIFRDWNFPKRIERALFPMVPGPGHADQVEGLRRAMRAFNAAGVTAIYEGHGIPPEPQRAYLDLWGQRALTVRTYFVVQFPIALFADPAGTDALIRATAQYAAGPGFGDDLLRFGGLGFSFDSASAIGASLMREPYRGARGVLWHGVQHVDDATFVAVLWKAARANLRVQAQAAGGAAIDKVLGMYEEIHREVPITDRRWVIEHCQFPSDENMATCRRLGVIPTSTTNFLWLQGSVYLRSFGPELTREAVPFKRWLDAGVPAVQSTDGRPYSPIFTFWQSLARRDGLTGEELSTPRQKLSRPEALRLYTLNAARVAFWEDRLGSLEPGKLADLVILSDDIMQIPEDRIPDTRVLATLLGGAPVHDTGLIAV